MRYSLKKLFLCLYFFTFNRSLHLPAAASSSTSGVLYQKMYAPRRLNACVVTVTERPERCELRKTNLQTADVALVDYTELWKTLLSMNCLIYLVEQVLLHANWFAILISSWFAVQLFILALKSVVQSQHHVVACTIFIMCVIRNATRDATCTHIDSNNIRP